MLSPTLIVQLELSYLFRVQAETVIGPSSDLFEGSGGFNYMKFLTNDTISAGDKLVITAMGRYAI